MKKSAPQYAETEHARRKLAEGYRQEAKNTRWKKAERAEFARMAETWERTLPKGPAK